MILWVALKEWMPWIFLVGWESVCLLLTKEDTIHKRSGTCIAFICCRLWLTFERTEVTVSKVMFTRPKRYHLSVLADLGGRGTGLPAFKHGGLQSFPMPKNCPPLTWIIMLLNDCRRDAFSSVWIYWIAPRFSILVHKIWVMKIIGAKIYAQRFSSHH